MTSNHNQLDLSVMTGQANTVSSSQTRSASLPHALANVIELSRQDSPLVSKCLNSRSIKRVALRSTCYLCVCCSTKRTGSQAGSRSTVPSQIGGEAAARNLAETASHSAGLPLRQGRPKLLILPFAPRTLDFAFT